MEPEEEVMVEVVAVVVEVKLIVVGGWLLVVGCGWCSRNRK
jgi:hypothetical protein